MAELDLRMSLELHNRIKKVCLIHDVSVGDFCRKAAKQFYSGKIKSVVHHELLKGTTYNGSRIQSRKWGFDLKGKKLIAVLIAVLIKLENTETIKIPESRLIEGIDYYIKV